MTLTNNSRDSIPPLPLIDLTMEQEFKMRQIEDALNKKDVDKKDIITVFISLQHQNFVLANNLKQLLNQW
jgi:hypothetical protein